MLSLFLLDSSFFFKSLIWIVKGRHRVVLAQRAAATLVPAPAEEYNPTTIVVAPVVVVAPGGTAVGGGAAVVGVGAAGDRGKTKDEGEEEGVVAVVMGVVTQE